MAIRGPQKPPVQQPGVQPQREQPQSPVQRLMDFGAARTPQEARRLVQELLAALRGAGFPVPKIGSPDGQLSQALKTFQEQRGLPADGVLDRATHDALVDGGLLPKKSDDAQSAEGAKKKDDVSAKLELGVPRFPSEKLGGEKRGLPTGGEAPAGSKQAVEIETQQKVEFKEKNKPPEIDLKSFLTSMRAAGFAGAGKGADQLKDALKKLQQREGLPSSGQLDAKTAEALVRRGILPESALAAVIATKADSAPSALAQENAARSTTLLAQQDATARGVPEGQGDPQAIAGRGDGAGDAARPGAEKSGGQGTTTTAKPGATGTVDQGDPGGTSDDVGNAPGGDDRVDDERRGHASVDDGEQHAEGHYEVPALSLQILEGLANIMRDDDGRGAATYAWDFTLYRPGIYGKKQPAEKLFHLVVSKASAFDPLWEEAREKLNEKLALLEPDAFLVEKDDVARALRIARVK